MFTTACPPTAGGGLTRRRPRELTSDLEEQESTERDRLTAPGELSRDSLGRGPIGEAAGFSRGALELQTGAGQAKYAKPAPSTKLRDWRRVWVVLTAAILGYLAADAVAPHIYRKPAAALSDGPLSQSELQPRREVLYRRNTVYNTSSFTVPDKLNVHFVPHSHQDLGWVKTYHEYYLGYHNHHARFSVELILDTVIQQLVNNPDRTFSEAETVSAELRERFQGFFYLWWRQQSRETKEVVRRLVEEGQLEFVNGGWSMHDEAASHYVDMIDQTSLGHRFLVSKLGVVPRTGWQIDPFGHSTVQAYLMGAEAGLDFLFFARISRPNWQKRNREKTNEFVWRASEHLGEQGQIFGGRMFNHYTAPDGFDFETLREDSIEDDLSLGVPDIVNRMNHLIKHCEHQSRAIRSNHIMLNMGGDFTYNNAITWYKNMDKLIHYLNQDGRVHALYSNPTLYAEAKHKADEAWPLKTGDFFPYQTCHRCFWVGYYASRTTFKRYVRQLSALLQAARQLEVAAGAFPGPMCVAPLQQQASSGARTRAHSSHGARHCCGDDSMDPACWAPPELQAQRRGGPGGGVSWRRKGRSRGCAANAGGGDEAGVGGPQWGRLDGKRAASSGTARLERIMAVTQHHDAVTGTAKQHVNDDYIKKLYEGAREVCHDAVTGMAKQHMNDDYTKKLYKGALEAEEVVTSAAARLFRVCPGRTARRSRQRKGSFADPSASVSASSGTPHDSDVSRSEGKIVRGRGLADLLAGREGEEEEVQEGDGEGEEVDVGEEDVYGDSLAWDSEDGWRLAGGAEAVLQRAWRRARVVVLKSVAAVASASRWALNELRLLLNHIKWGEAAAGADGAAATADAATGAHTATATDAAAVAAVPVAAEGATTLPSGAAGVGVAPTKQGSAEGESVHYGSPNSTSRSSDTTNGLETSISSSTRTSSSTLASTNENSSTIRCGSSISYHSVSSPEGMEGAESSSLCSEVVHEASNGTGSEPSREWVRDALEEKDCLPPLDFHMCPMLNISYCPTTQMDFASEGHTLVISAYNPLAWSRTEAIRIPVATAAVHVTDADGTPVPSQIIPTPLLIQETRSFHIRAYVGPDAPDPAYNSQSQQNLTMPYTLIFRAPVPALSFAVFYVARSAGNTPPAYFSHRLVLPNIPAHQDREYVVKFQGEAGGAFVEDPPGGAPDDKRAVFSLPTGRLVKLFQPGAQNEPEPSGVTVRRDQILYYEGVFPGLAEHDGVSGAYVFRPRADHPVSLELGVNPGQDEFFDATPVPPVRVFTGPVVVEVHRYEANWGGQVYRFYKDEPGVEMEYVVGPVPNGNDTEKLIETSGDQKDIVKQFITTMKTGKAFFVDANGREYIKRVRNVRSDWKLNVTEPVAGNYYPINAGIYMSDGNQDFSVLVDRAAGGGCPEPGRMEIMLHRRLTSDDSLGVDEPLLQIICTSLDPNTTASLPEGFPRPAGLCRTLATVGTLDIAVQPPRVAAEWRRSKAQRKYSPLELAFASVAAPVERVRNSFVGKSSCKDAGHEPYELPPNVALTTLQRLEAFTLVRLAHLYEASEDPQLSKPATVDLRKLLSGFQVKDAEELTLTANQKRSQKRKPLKWKVEGEGYHSPRDDLKPVRGSPFDPRTMLVELFPLEIRTFAVYLE